MRESSRQLSSVDIWDFPRGNFSSPTWRFENFHVGIGIRG